MATFFFLVPMAWFAFDAWLARRKLPTVAEWRAGQRPALRAFTGAAICVIVLVAATSALFGVARLVDGVEGEDRGARHRAQHQQRRACATCWPSRPSLSAKALTEHRRPGPVGRLGTMRSA